MAGGLVTSLRLGPGANSANPEVRRSFLLGSWRLCTPSLIPQSQATETIWSPKNNVEEHDLKNLSIGLNLSRGLNMVGST